MSTEPELLKPRDLMECTGITRQLLQNLVTMRLIEPAQVTETGRYLYDQQTVTAVKAYLHWRDLGYPQAEIRRMFQHRFKRSTDDPAPSEEADR